MSLALDEAPRQRKRLSRAQAQKERRLARERFIKARRAERFYGRQLRAVAKQVGAVVRIMAPNGVIKSMAQLNAALGKYSEMLRPWATVVAERMIAEVERRDEMAWAELGEEIGRNLRREVKSAPLVPIYHELMAEQVELITSLPREASKRVHKLMIEGMVSGGRAKEAAQEIMRTGEVTQNRAMLIARTETSRTVTATVKARAEHIGSEGYIWRTAEDADVRPLHRKLDGRFFRWDAPPVAGENGERAHPGAIYNCRCYPEPVLPEDI